MVFNPEDWDIEPEVETGNDDFVYGNYVEWDIFRDENEEALLEHFGVDLPWDKSLTLNEYIDFISQDIFQKTNLCQELLKESLFIEQTSELLYGILIKFIGRSNDVANNLISNIFDYYGVPSGTAYEYELPDELRFWQNNFLDYDDYKRYPIKVDKYRQTITDLFEKIDSSTDQFVKKALIFSSLSVTESMFKSVIVEKIPKENGISDFGNEILQSEISKILRGRTEEQNKLFKKLYNKKAPNQYWTDLRNSLAHDIEGPSVKNDEVTYLNLRTRQEEKYSISCLKEQLFKFSQDIKAIIDNC